MSTVNDSDTILVNRGGLSYQCQMSNLDKLLDTDIVLVNRGGLSYQMPWSEKSKLDVVGTTMLINRSSASYQVDGVDVLAAIDTSGWQGIVNNINRQTWSYNPQGNGKVYYNEAYSGRMFDGSFTSSNDMSTQANFICNEWWNLEWYDSTGFENTTGCIAVYFTANYSTTKSIRLIVQASGVADTTYKTIMPGQWVEWSNAELNYYSQTFKTFGVYTNNGGFDINISAVDINCTPGGPYKPTILPYEGNPASILTFNEDTDFNGLKTAQQYGTECPQVYLLAQNAGAGVPCKADGTTKKIYSKDTNEWPTTGDMAQWIAQDPLGTFLSAEDDQFHVPHVDEPEIPVNDGPPTQQNSSSHGYDLYDIIDYDES